MSDHYIFFLLVDIIRYGVSKVHNWSTLEVISWLKSTRDGKLCGSCTGMSQNDSHYFWRVFDHFDRILLKNTKFSKKGIPFFFVENTLPVENESHFDTFPTNMHNIFKTLIDKFNCKIDEAIHFLSVSTFNYKSLKI